MVTKRRSQVDGFFDTTEQLINYSGTWNAGAVVETDGFSVKGDGNGSKWLLTGDIISPSYGDVDSLFISDPQGNEFKKVIDNVDLITNPYKVGKDKVLRDPSGGEFIFKGVQAFVYLFINFEYREDYRYRTHIPTLTLPDGSTVTTGASTGISAPSGAARFRFIDREYVRSIILPAYNYGMNAIQIGVEAAMQFVPEVGYIDPVDGKPYPSEMKILDILIQEADKLGMVVVLRQDNDQLPVNECSDFLTFLAKRYAKQKNVWINPRNEINCAPILQPGGGSIPNPNCSVPSVWVSDMEAYITAIRTDTGFDSPIIINPTDYGANFGAVEPFIDASAILSGDDNLIVGTHIYQNIGDGPDFFPFKARDAEVSWRAGFEGKYCLMIDEVGFANDGNNYDPATGVPIWDMTIYNNKKSWLTQMLKWFQSKTINTKSVVGATALTWNANFDGTYYEFSPMYYDQTTKLLSEWGDIFVDNFVNRKSTGAGITGVTLEKVSADLMLIPKYSDLIVVDNNMIAIKSTGINLLNVHPIPENTAHWVYFGYVNGELELTVSLDAPTENYIGGYLCKSTDQTQTLVGAVYFESGVGIPDSGRRLFFRSYYNEDDFIIEGEVVSDTAITSASATPISDDIKIEFLAFPDEKFVTTGMLNYKSSVAEVVTYRFETNGVAQETVAKNYTATIDEPLSLSVRTDRALNAGYNKIILQTSSPTSTVTTLAGSRVTTTKI